MNAFTWVLGSRRTSATPDFDGRGPRAANAIRSMGEDIWLVSIQPPIEAEWGQVKEVIMRSMHNSRSLTDALSRWATATMPPPADDAARYAETVYVDILYPPRGQAVWPRGSTVSAHGKQTQGEAVPREEFLSPVLTSIPALERREGLAFVDRPVPAAFHWQIPFKVGVTYPEVWYLSENRGECLTDATYEGIAVGEMQDDLRDDLCYIFRVGTEPSRSPTYLLVWDLVALREPG